MGRKYGYSFSWKRALGVSSAKHRIARMTGIPTTKQGRQRKIGRMMGCALPTTLIVSLLVLSIMTLVK
jgi:hypothetical protein